MNDRKLLMLIRAYGDVLRTAGYNIDRDEDDNTAAEREGKRIMGLIRAGLASRKSANGKEG